MSFNTSILYNFAELSMLRVDADYYFHLVKYLIELQTTAPISIIAPGCYPLFCLFTIEADSYLRQHSQFYTSIAMSAEHETLRRAARNRTKLLGNNTSPISSLFVTWENIAKWNLDYFMNIHNGFLATLKKQLQPDVGLYFVNDHLISSTYTIFYNFCFDDKDATCYSNDGIQGLFPLSSKLGSELGAQIAVIESVTNVLPARQVYDIVASPPKASSYTRGDVKADTYFRSLYEVDTPFPISCALTSLLIAGNFMCYFIDSLSNLTHETAFKAAYVTLYNITQLLRDLRNYSARDGLLSQVANQRIDAILRDDTLKMLRHKKEEFRNILVHYSFTERSKAHVPASKLDLDAPLCGIIGLFFPYSSLEELSSLTFAQLKRVTRLLEEWFVDTGGNRVRKVPLLGKA